MIPSINWPVLHSFCGSVHESVIQSVCSWKRRQLSRWLSLCQTVSQHSRQWASPSGRHSVSQADSQSVSPLEDQYVSQTFTNFVSLSVSHSVRLSSGQSVSQTVNYSVIHPLNQSVNHWDCHFFGMSDALAVNHAAILQFRHFFYSSVCHRVIPCKSQSVVHSVRS